MSTYRKKPVEIEAIQLPGRLTSLREFNEWCDKVGFRNWVPNGKNGIEIATLEGTMTAIEGDWIIRGVKGEFYPCKPDIFEATYDFVR